LEVVEGPPGGGSEDPVGATAVETEMVQRVLQLGDVVASQHRRRQHEQAFTQRPSRFDDRQPRLLVAFPTRVQTSFGLKCADGRLGRCAKRTRLGTDRSESGGTEAAL
jgi:hypothetical protein